MNPARRPLALMAAMACALALAELPLPAAQAAGERSVRGTCANAPSSSFTDVGDTFDDTIDCVTWFDVAEGFGDDTYRPNFRNTRGQMAAFLARLYDAIDAPLSGPGLLYDPWVDDGGNFEEEIERITDLGIVDERDDRMFRPGDRITRGRMARWLVRLVDVAQDGDLDGPGRAPSAFPDDSGHPDERFIDRAAELQLVGGFADGTYRPGNAVTRGQMSAFLVRAADVLVEGNDLQRPDDRRVVTGVSAPDDTYSRPGAPAEPPPGGTFARYPQRPTWDPCATVHVVVNYAGMPSGAPAVVDDVLAELRRRTGLRVVLAGRTPFRPAVPNDAGARPLEGYGLGDQVLTIATAFEPDPAGSDAITHLRFTAASGSTDGTILDAQIALSPNGPASELDELLLHELGHAVGLDHVNDTNEIMNPSIQRTTYGPGDRNGLHDVGPGEQDCRR